MITAAIKAQINALSEEDIWRFAQNLHLLSVPTYFKDHANWNKRDCEKAQKALNQLYLERASTDLLEVAQLLVQDFDRDPKVTGWYADTVEKARKAIAKAEGKTIE